MDRTAHPATAAALLAVALAGCVTTGFTRTASVNSPPRPPGCYVEVVLTPQPLYPYVIIGRVTAEGTAPGIWGMVGENESVALQRLRDEACAAGGHFIMNPDTGSNASWNRDGFSRSSRGAAVVGVYVTPQGQVLPPPTGATPAVVIPGQYPQQAPAAPPR